MKQKTKKNNHSEGYLLRAQKIQEIDREHYQPYHDSCHRMVWKKYVYPVYGCNYRTFLLYLKADTSGLPEGKNPISSTNR